MKSFSFAGTLLLALVLSPVVAHAQTTPATPGAQQSADSGITPNGAIGEVKVIDAAGKQMIIKTDAGSLVTVVLNDATAYMRVAPGESTLTQAT